MNHFFDVQQNTDTNWNMAQFHFHDSYEIIIVLEGQGEMRIASQSYSLTKGVVVLLDTSTLHKSTSNGDFYKRYVFKFPSEYISALSTEKTDLRKLFSTKSPCILLSEEQLLSIHTLCEKTMDAKDVFGNDLLRQNAFISLLIALNTLADTSFKISPHYEPDANRITAIMDFIAKNAASDITLDDIAAEFYITKQHLCYVFKKSTGLGINQYLTAQRLTLACSYLRQGIGVQSAGEKAGFHNNSHFIRTFKKAFGISPGKYLASYKNTVFV